MTTRTYIVPGSQGCSLDQTLKECMENHHESGVTWAAVKRRWGKGGGKREVFVWASLAWVSWEAWRSAIEKRKCHVVSDPRVTIAVTGVPVCFLNVGF